ncbi:MAG: hypothetical protein V1756_01655 [Patescibacteria group bacterium]
MKIVFKNIRNIVGQIPRVLAENSFFVVIVSIILTVALGAVVFYKYDILVKKSELQNPDVPFKFQEKIYEEIIGEWQDREKIFNEAGSKQYMDPFKTSAPADID